jgi:hypothetical protein
VVGGLIYEYWGTIWPAMQAVFKAFCDNVGKAASGLGKILLGAVTFDIAKVKEGLVEVAHAFAEGAKQVGESFKPRITTSSEQVASAKTAGDELGKAEAAARARALMAEEDRTRKLTLQAQRAGQAAEILELTDHTSKVVALKKKEAKLLGDLAKAKTGAEKAALRSALADTRNEYEHSFAEESKSRAKFDANTLKASKKFQSLSAKEQKRFLSSHTAALVGSMKTESDVREEAALAELQREIDTDNTFLAEQERFGTAYATINKAMHNSILTQSQTATNELEQLTQSKNSTLKGIGKAAAATNIAIKTAEGALAAYAGFCQIPIVGPALGIAAAGAVTAFGIEREAQVLGAAQGGLVTGGTRGIDSVPAMLTPGELVAPAKNFDEVVNAVADRRLGGRGDGPPQEVKHTITIDFKGSASQVLTAQINQDKALGRYRGRQ